MCVGYHHPLDFLPHPKPLPRKPSKPFRARSFKSTFHKNLNAEQDSNREENFAIWEDSKINTRKQNNEKNTHTPRSKLSVGGPHPTKIPGGYKLVHENDPKCSLTTPPSQLQSLLCERCDDRKSKNEWSQLTGHNWLVTIFSRTTKSPNWMIFEERHEINE
jgi:hypothetical protein